MKEFKSGRGGDMSGKLGPGKKQGRPKKEPSVIVRIPESKKELVEDLKEIDFAVTPEIEKLVSGYKQEIGKTLRSEITRDSYVQDNKPVILTGMATDLAKQRKKSYFIGKHESFKKTAVVEVPTYVLAENTDYFPENTKLLEVCPNGEIKGSFDEDNKVGSNAPEATSRLEIQKAIDLLNNGLGLRANAGGAIKKEIRKALELLSKESQS